MGKYSGEANLRNTEDVDLSHLDAGAGAGESANTVEPATHVNRMAERTGYTVQQIRALERLEGKFEGGGMQLSPKEKLLAAPDAAALNPDMKLRWVSLRNVEKLNARIEEGYAKVPETQGGRQLGDSMALFAIPRRLHEARVKRQEENTRARLNSIRENYAEAGERLVHALKKQHGLSDSQIRRLIINE